MSAAQPVTDARQASTEHLPDLPLPEAYGSTKSEGSKMKKSRGLIGLTVAAALLLSGCAGSSGDAPSEEDGDGVSAELIESLGGQEQYDRLMALYEEAVAAGQTKVTLYGPEVVNQTPVLAEAWSQVFPEITLEGVHMLGAQAADRLRAEAETGNGIGDLYVSGPATMATNEQYFAELETFAGAEIGEEWRGGKGFVTVALTPFAIAYNTQSVAEDEIPDSWDIAFDPDWQGRLSLPDPSAGIALEAISALLYSDVWTEADLEAFAGNGQTVVPLSNFNGPLTNVAQEQSDAALWVSTPQIQEAIGSGAPVGLAFPLSSSNMVAREMVGLIASAPSPIAAELYANWRLTEHGADAVAEYGQYSLVEGADAPDGLPELGEVDLLPTVPYGELLPTLQQRAPLIKQLFGL
jgi:ABC-type Fe3+ transport system substrate-binding protein